MFATIYVNVIELGQISARRYVLKQLLTTLERSNNLVGGGGYRGPYEPLEKQLSSVCVGVCLGAGGGGGGRGFVPVILRKPTAT